MKKHKQILSMVLALVLCLGLTPSAFAYDTGKVGEWNILSAGDDHTAAIDQNGSLWMWGDNNYGQLGNGTTTDSDRPIKVMDNVAAVSCGGSFTAAIQTDGSLWMWGRNYYGQLGNGTTTDSYTPIKVMDNVAAVSCGGSFTAAIQTDGSLWMWGNNDPGQLGNGRMGNDTNDGYSGSYPIQTIPVKIMGDVAAVSCGGNHTAAIKTDGSLWMWGSGLVGQLGNGTRRGSYTPIKVMDNVVAISCGNSHTAAIKTDSSLWMWGRNGDGQLGTGSTETSYSDTPIKVMDNVAAVSCGEDFTAAIQTDSSLWTWGVNWSSQLGNGGRGEIIRLGAVPIQIVEADPYKVTDGVATVNCGDSHTAAIKTDSSLWMWGDNGEGQLGNGGVGDSTRNGDPIQTVPIQITGVSMPKGVRLYLNGGMGGGNLWTSADGTITVPTNPTRAGYTFGGWYTDEALTIPWNFNDVVVNTLVLYAKWVPVSSTATQTGKNTQSISLDGEIVSIDAYTLVAGNGGTVTYVKLRDVAALLEGTEAGFNVDWRNRSIYVSSRSDYTTKNGTELKAITGADGSYKWNSAPVLFDGVTKALEGIVITDGNGGGHTFFKLRDLGAALGFNVGWSADRGIFLESDKPYTGTD